MAWLKLLAYELPENPRLARRQISGGLPEEFLLRFLRFCPIQVDFSTPVCLSEDVEDFAKNCDCDVPECVVTLL